MAMEERWNIKKKFAVIAKKKQYTEFSDVLEKQTKLLEQSILRELLSGAWDVKKEK